jgi:predicted lactoylglutathione lyase
MATKVFINLPVKNLAKSMEFFQNLGFSFNPQFTDEKAASMVVSDSIFVMLLTDTYFKTFINNEICDAHKATEVLIALDANSTGEVKQMVDKAQSLGGRLYAQPQDHGWMYQHSFADLDGHKWEIVYMDQSQLPTEG